jgi:crotonobetainyl-CoA:carnitine CoA-transferase CaiB-like acyl-CoA transferase
MTFGPALLIVGILVLSTGLLLDETVAAHVGGAVATVGVWITLAAEHVVVSELYVAPVALHLLITGVILRHRTDASRPSSWVAYGPAIALLAGCAIAERIAGGPAWHSVLAVAIGVVAVAIGGWKRALAPLLLGTGTLVVVGVREMLDTNAGIPTWAWLATGGVALIAAAIAMERSDVSPVEAGPAGRRHHRRALRLMPRALRKTAHVSTDGLLAGVRILDFTIWRPGPYATQLLAELGADVIKIEPPGGDPMRAYPGLFSELNVNKRSVMLDLKDGDGRRHALALVAEADVVIEGFRPGVAVRLGIGADDIHAVNTRAVYCSVSGMGQYGELSTAPGHDLNFQAWSGALAPDGGAPVTAAVPIADLAGGMAAAFAICAAVVRQQRTGDGETIDVAMGDVLATWTGAIRPLATGVDENLRGVPGYGTFPTADGGYVTLGIITEDHFWSGLCDTLGMSDARGLSFLERMPRLDEFQARVARAIAARDRDPLVEDLLAAGVPAAPVLDRDGMIASAHFRARDVVLFEGEATAAATGHPVRFAQQPARHTSRAPALDEHHDAAFAARASRHNPSA